MRLNKVLTRKTTRCNCGQLLLSVVLVYPTCACMEFHMFWAVALIYQCGGKKEHYVWSI